MISVHKNRISKNIIIKLINSMHYCKKFLFSHSVIQLCRGNIIASEVNCIGLCSSFCPDTPPLLPFIVP